jgi:hypothetical protein
MQKTKQFSFKINQFCNWYMTNIGLMLLESIIAHVLQAWIKMQKTTWSMCDFFMGHKNSHQKSSQSFLCACVSVFVCVPVQKLLFMRFEVLMVRNVHIMVFRDVKPCSLVDRYSVLTWWERGGATSSSLKHLDLSTVCIVQFQSCPVSLRTLT